MSQRYLGNGRCCHLRRWVGVFTAALVILCYWEATLWALPSNGVTPFYSIATSVELPQEKEELSHVVPCEQGLGVVYGGEALAFFPNNGLRLSWKKTLDGGVRDVLCIQGNLVAVGGNITAFDVKSGEMTWNYPLTGLRVVGVDEEVLFVSGFEPDFGQVMAVSLTNGEHRWRSWQMAVGVTEAVLEPGDIVVMKSGQREVTRLKLTTGRVLSGVAAQPQNSGGLGGYPVAGKTEKKKSTRAWESVGKFQGEHWLIGKEGLLWLEGNDVPEVIGRRGEELYVRAGSRLLAVAPQPLGGWVEGCRVALGESGPEGERCGRFLELRATGLKKFQGILKSTVSTQLRVNCEQGLETCGLWARWLGLVMSLDDTANQQQRYERALELGLLAIEMGVQGKFEYANRLVEAIRSVRGPRWDVLTFGLACLEARKVLDGGRKAFRKGRLSEASSSIFELENMQDIQSILPESIVDAGDGKRLMKKAFRDLNDVMPELNKNGSNQGLCLFRCQLLAELEARQTTDQGCTSSCAL